MNHPPHQTLWLISCTALLSISTLAIHGCSSTQPATHRVLKATEHIQDPIRSLQAQAELELLSPIEQIDPSIFESFVPKSIPQLAPGSPGYAKALTEHDQILTQALEHRPERFALLAAQEASPNEQSLKLYTQARSLRQAGDTKQAIELLQQAATLDPGSSGIQRELGNALNLNDRIAAASAYEQAIKLGDHSPSVLVHVASIESSKGNDEIVLWLTAKALSQSSINNHPTTRSIARVLMGISQIELGYLKAGSDTLTQALHTFDASSRDLQWKREIIDIMSNQAQLWMLAGDAWSAIGALERAGQSYNQAARTSQHPPSSLVARQIVSKLRRGQRAGASMVFLEHLEQRATDLGSQERRWARSLGTIAQGDDTLAKAVRSLRLHDGLPNSIARSLLSIELELLEQDAQIDLLGESGTLGDDPLLCLLVLENIETEEERFEACVQVLKSNPGIARSLASGLSRTLAQPIEFLQSHHSPKAPLAEQLVAAIGIGLGRADLVEHLSHELPADAHKQSNHWLATHAQGYSLVGRWDLANQLINQLRQRANAALPIDNQIDDQVDEQADTNNTWRLLASTLFVSGQPIQAWELVNERADSADASIEDLLLAAQIAGALDRFDASATFLERALEIDPYIETIYEQLFMLRSPPSPIANNEDLRDLVRQLSSTKPRSPLLGVIRANELARNGLISKAQSLLNKLNADHPYSEIGYDLLLSIWKTLSTQDQPEALSNGAQWLEDRLKTNPNSIETILKLAMVYNELAQPDRSLDLLHDAYARTGSFEIARVLELHLAQENQQASDMHLVNRVSQLKGVSPSIEYASYLADKATPEATAELLKLLDDRLPTELTLVPAQITQLSQIVFVLAESVETLHNESSLLELISIIERRSEKLNFQLSRIKVLLLSSQPTIDMDRLVDTVIQASAACDTDEQRSMIRALPIQSLLGEDRTHEAIALTTKFATNQGVLDPSYTIETFRLLGAVGTNSDMIGVLEKLDELGLMQRTIEITANAFGTPKRDTPAISADQQRADLSYMAAVLASAFEQEEQSDSYYELALSYDSDHAWSNNDFGYKLAERGLRIDYAVKLLERAAQALPNEASVIDSLAWVRYKMGIFDDQAGPDGNIIHGAITLLTRANELDTEQNNATIMLHLGDALWRGGYEQQAIDAWIEAEEIARSRLRLLNANPNPNQRAIDAIAAELKDIRYRIQDAESTGTPPIEPLADGYGSDIQSSIEDGP